MTGGGAQAASDLLLGLWARGQVIAALPDDLRPASRAGGYAIQALAERAAPGPLYGWKLAATSAAGQAHIGVDGPLAGRLLAHRVIASGGTVPAGVNRMAVAEPEFAFRLRADLPPRAAPYDLAEVMAAVASVHAALEIPDSRYADFARVGAAQLIADNACAHWFVLAGATAADWRALDLSTHRVTAWVEGGEVAEGSGANVLGDPWLALTWLANELSQFGPGLRAGQVVTTGTCAAPLPIHPGATATADFGVLGRVTARFA